ncbi:GAF domain-containing protein [Amycolatopsis sp. A133]|uniref:GAF domain-containing protein n=1 Tax=Amycolatopsis sp. A133 TaxID=3064472 RepID=UPI0027FC713E|nr:GAF domain-containing protein [Amycolatopsis sp. A133]MDQ7810735.1 GAF domain-containing protein [Amycolatopsis sp. A133]
MHATDHVSAGLEDLQLTVGEGPCLDAFASGGPVLIADLAAATARWPAFTPAACELGAAAVFSVPLQIGVVRLGSLDLYRETPGPPHQSRAGRRAGPQ